MPCDTRATFKSASEFVESSVISFCLVNFDTRYIYSRYTGRTTIQLYFEQTRHWNIDILRVLLQSTTDAANEIKLKERSRVILLTNARSCIIVYYIILSYVTYYCSHAIFFINCLRLRANIIHTSCIKIYFAA